MDYITWLRSKLGSRKIILVYSDIILRDEAGRILLQLRVDNGLWGLTGGILEIGESWEQCARRELAEETGLVAGPLQLVGIYTDPRYDSVYPNGDAVQQFTVCFMAQAAGGVMQADSAESHALRWFDPDRLPRSQMDLFYTTMIDAMLAGAPPVFLPPSHNGTLREYYAIARRFVGHETLILPGAMVIVERADGRILLIRRSDIGEWWPPSGYTMLGENVANTAVREVWEEAGLRIDVDRIIGIYSEPYHVFPNGDQVQNAGILFRAHPLSAELQPNSAEVSDVGWFTRDEWLQKAVEYPFGRLARLATDHLDQGVFIA
ncbi:MAG: NUDIX domain-containing protein [Anaerolineae bacterium]|nr:NUDIX domain-containing protein [Anaerolineae bacterium]